jgi:anti-sigma factor RsiW
MKRDLELKLQAWVDGELPAAEAEQMRRLVGADAEAASLAAELQTMKAAFAEDGQTAVVPETREFYWSKIERQIQREAAFRRADGLSWAARLRRWLVPLAGVASLAAVLVVALNQVSPRQEAFNQVSGMLDGFQPRTFRDGQSGISFVVFHETAQSSAPGAGAAPVRIRNDGSSFTIDTE